MPGDSNWRGGGGLVVLPRNRNWALGDRNWNWRGVASGRLKTGTDALSSSLWLERGTGEHPTTIRQEQDQGRRGSVSYLPSTEAGTEMVASASVSLTRQETGIDAAL